MNTPIKTLDFTAKAEPSWKPIIDAFCQTCIQTCQSYGVVSEDVVRLVLDTSKRAFFEEGLTASLPNELQQAHLWLKSQIAKATALPHSLCYRRSVAHRLATGGHDAFDSFCEVAADPILWKQLQSLIEAEGYTVFNDTEAYIVTVSSEHSKTSTKYTHSPYCIKQCPKGKKKLKELLDTCESGLDAGLDMQAFVQCCSLTCPYQVHRITYDAVMASTMGGELSDLERNTQGTI